MGDDGTDVPDSWGVAIVCHSCVRLEEPLLWPQRAEPRGWTRTALIPCSFCYVGNWGQLLCHFFPPFVALRDAGSEVPSYSLGSCIRCDLCTPINKDTEVKKHWNLHYQTWMVRRVHVTCIAMMQGSVPSLHIQPWIAFSLLLPIKMLSHCDKRATQEQWKPQRALLACDVMRAQCESCVRVVFPP